MKAKKKKKGMFFVRTCNILRTLDMHILCPHTHLKVILVVVERHVPQQFHRRQIRFFALLFRPSSTVAAAAASAALDAIACRTTPADFGWWRQQHISFV